MKKLIPLLFLSAGAFADQECEPTHPVSCNEASCNCVYCLGPINYQGNAPVRPLTCNGDIAITVAGFYWTAHQDGLEYAIDNAANVGATLLDAVEANNLSLAKYRTPDFDWDFGFKLGLTYYSTCDGWDIGVLWTWFKNSTNSHIEADADDNRILIPLFSAFQGSDPFSVLARDITTTWKLDLNVIDLFLGREYWVGKYLNMRPHVGLRIAYLKQSFDLLQKGGNFSAVNVVATDLLAQPAFTDENCMDNDFKGVGIHAGFDLSWHFGCGWSLYSELATALVYGRFDIDQDENIRLASTPFSRSSVYQADDNFRASRAMVDLSLGIQWESLFCDCQYAFMARLGWEQHLFFHQNQLWRIRRNGEKLALTFPNNSGQNVYAQSRGTLSTEGVTLTVQFSF